MHAILYAKLFRIICKVVLVWQTKDYFQGEVMCLENLVASDIGDHYSNS